MSENHIDIFIKGLTVFVEDRGGAWKTKGHRLSLPRKNSDFQKQLRLLRFEPGGMTPEERESDRTRMELEIGEAGGLSSIARNVGETLFDALLPPDTEAYERYATVVDSKPKSGHSTHVSLTLETGTKSEGPSVLTLPWEYLYDKDRGFFLGCREGICLSRRIPLRKQDDPPAVRLPLKVLVMVSEPHNQTQFGREEAWHRIEQGLEAASSAGDIEYRLLPQPTFDSLAATVGEWQPHVLHFVGHGSFYDEKGGALAFEDPCGATDHISGRRLQQLLGGTSLRLVFLTSCRSAETDPGDDFAGVAQALVMGRIPAVISMQFSMPVVSGNVFDRAFYAALRQRLDIDEAVTAARRGLFASSDSACPRDWGIPVLYRQSELRFQRRKGQKPSHQLKTVEAEIPNNLDRFAPLRSSKLAGRGNDLIRLARALRESDTGHRFVTLTGLGGIGKTALALESAHWHMERRCFPQGVFWISAKDTAVEVVFQQVADLFGLPEFNRLDMDGKIEVIRSVMTDYEVLLVIDNADSLREDKTFRRFLGGLPAASSGKVLLTSRRTMDLDGEREVRLKPIGQDAAIGVFLNIWGEPVNEDGRKQAAKVCELLGGHPFSITIAASLARKEKRRDLASLTNRLKQSLMKTLKHSTPEGEKSIEASLAISWNALGRNARLLLSNLSVYHLPFREEAAAAVAPEGSQWRPSLTELLEHNLLTVLADRYYIHPIVQDFAGSRLRSARKIHQKAGDFLVNTQYLEEHLEGIDHLESAGDWPGVRDGITAIVGQLHLHGYWEVAQAKLEQGLAAVRLLGDKKSESNTLGELGGNYLRRGKGREAIGYYEQALTIAKEIGDSRGRGSCLCGLGLAYAHLGEVKKAIGYHEKALTIARKIGDRVGEDASLSNLGNAYAHLGEVKKAIGYHEKALTIAREIDDRAREGMSLGNLGNAYARLGEIKKAIGYHEQSLAIAKETGNRAGEGADLGNLGVLHADLGDMKKAIGYYEQALAIAREVGDARGEGNRMCNLGSAHYRLGDMKKAIGYYEQSLAIAREIGDRYGEGNNLGNMGNAYRHLGDVKKAVSCYVQALAIARETGDRYGEASHLCNLGSVCADLGEVKEAIGYYEQALAIARQIGDKRSEGNHLGNLGYAYLLIGEYRKALSCLMPAEEILKETGSASVQVVQQNMVNLRKKIGGAEYRRLEARVRKSLPREN